MLFKNYVLNFDMSRLSAFKAPNTLKICIYNRVQILSRTSEWMKVKDQT